MYCSKNYGKNYSRKKLGIRSLHFHFVPNDLVKIKERQCLNGHENMCPLNSLVSESTKEDHSYKK